jgi:WD40 repeat protein
MIFFFSFLRHHNQCVLFTGKGSKTQPLIQRNAIHYLSLYDNKIMRNFKGHAGEVTDLNMSPVDDTFLSSSTDRTVRYV